MAKICFTTILVHNMEQAVMFYAEKLNFAIIKRDHYPHFVLLQHDLYPIALHQVEKPTHHDDATQSQVILGIATDDVTASIQELQSQGVEFIHTTPQKFFGGYYAALRDPSGNVVELIQWQS